MKQLKTYLNESHNFLVNKKLKNRQDKYEYHPTTTELTSIIVDLLKRGITDLNCIDVSQITDMYNVFQQVNFIVPVKDIDISEWDVSNVNDMCCIFRDCEEFNADLSKWDVSKVEYMSGMFDRCKNFNSDLSKWNVSNVKYMAGMFSGCNKFNSDLSKWDVSNVVKCHDMFSECIEFNSDLSKWNITKASNMSGMFCNCYKLNFDMSNWYVFTNMKKINVRGMFYNALNMKKRYGDVPSFCANFVFAKP